MSLTLADLPPAFLAEVTVLPPQPAQPASLGQFGAIAFGAPPDPAPAAVPATVLRFSDRGYVGEPGDADRPNIAYPPRLLEPPRIERSIPVLPEDGARASFQSGEIVLSNADGALDYLGGDWSLAGRPVSLFRIPSRTPLALPFIQGTRVAELRTTAAPVSSPGRVSIGLREAAIDLNVPLTTAYAGTGGLEGDATLAGQPRPYLMGGVYNVEPVLLLSASLIYQVSANALFSVAPRDRGVTLSAAGDYGSLAALQSAMVLGGAYATCLALGLIRLGSTPEGRVTATVVANGPGLLPGMATALLSGPGGLTTDRYVAASFNVWPGGAAGFWWRGGTVAQAVNEIAASCAGWWNSDRIGRIVGGRLLPPDSLTPTVRIERWMLQSEPEEVAHPAPRYRQTVGFNRNHVVQSPSDLGAIGADSVRSLGQEYESAVWYDGALQQTAPGSTDGPVLVSGFRARADGQALADHIGAVHGRQRRRWTLSLGRYGALVDFGAVLEVDHPKLAGRRWQPVRPSEAGDDIRWEVFG